MARRSSPGPGALPLLSSSRAARQWRRPAGAGTDATEVAPVVMENDGTAVLPRLWGPPPSLLLQGGAGEVENDATSIDAGFKADTNKIKAKMPAGKLAPIASSQPAPIGIFVVT
uniref:Uncharacterized protein n=1 Tax=Oryza rufipogon TaxID=4529 RepID=A0A0E0RHE8_ORYRU